jgi:hypothetical protein
MRPKGGVVVKSVADIIREKLDAGMLPVNSPVKLWAGEGTGRICAACDEPILKSQVEYEPQYNDGAVIRFHAGCHGLWEAERCRRGYLLRDD